MELDWVGHLLLLDGPASSDVDKGTTVGKKRRIDEVEDIEVPNVDEKYKDTDADVLFQSKDGVLFKVHSFYLKTHSIVFRDMFANESFGHSPSSDSADNSEVHPNNKEDKKPIHLFYPSHAVRMWLDILDLTEDFTLEGRNLSHVKDAFSLARQFECRFACKALKLAIKENIPNAPFKTFLLAADMNDVRLAKWALRGMGKENFKPPGGRWDLFAVSSRLFKHCPTSYVLGFLRATTTSEAVFTYSQAPTSNLTATTNWEKVAAGFKLV